LVGVEVWVGVDVAVAVGVSVGVSVGVGVAVAVGVSVSVGVGVRVGVAVSVGVCVTVGVAVSVSVTVGVLVTVGVSVIVGVTVTVAVSAGVNEAPSPHVTLALVRAVGTGEPPMSKRALANAPSGTRVRDVVPSASHSIPRRTIAPLYVRVWKKAKQPATTAGSPGCWSLKMGVHAAGPR
jgi:hypothetical protein